MQIFENNLENIGKTPLIKINKLAVKNINIYAKLEGKNPSGSVKCRIANYMLEVAINEGKLKKGMKVVEPTSGNTGIGLAFACAIRDLQLVITMPETMSVERRKILEAMGAELILTEGSKGMKGAIAKAEELAQDTKKYFMPNQFNNLNNPKVHELTTGPEIYSDLNGKIDALVAGVGTGGTISGTSKYLKGTRNLKNLISVAVEPKNSPVISQFLNKEELKPASHKIQGIGAGFIPKTLDVSIIDKVVQVSDEDAKTNALQLAKEEGIFCGISGGAAFYAALEIANDLPKHSNIVVIIPDTAERYLSSFLFE